MLPDDIQETNSDDDAFFDVESDSNSDTEVIMLRSNLHNTIRLCHVFLMLLSWSKIVNDTTYYSQLKV